MKRGPAGEKPRGGAPHCADIGKELSRALELHRSGDIGRAETGYRAVLQVDPGHPDALHLLGMIESQKGNLHAAVDLIRQAIANFSGSDIFYSNLGNALSRLNRYDDAIDAYQQALWINPQSVATINNLATLLSESGRIDEAIQLFERALAINPGRAEVYNNLGNALTRHGRMNSAVACFDKAIALNPDYAVVLNNKGSALKQQGCFKAAIESFSRAVEINPAYAEAFNNLGEALADIGNPEEAIPFFRRALELKPDFGLACGNLYYALTRICDWNQAVPINALLDDYCDRAINSGKRPPEDPFLNLIRHDDPCINFQVASAWSAMLNDQGARNTPVFDFSGRKKKESKIAIGYLSGNFHDHPMAHLINRLLAVHDRNAFTILCFSSGPDDSSDYRKRIVEGCDRFVDIHHLDHRAAAQCIYDSKVDILIDLMGHTKGNRLEICAKRPAPIQARYLGMAGTTGSPFFDYLIADPTVVPEDHFPYYSEKIVHMPHCYQVNDRRLEDSATAASKAEEGLPERGCVFCSFNQPYKIDAIIFRAWMRILKQVPESVLWLQGGNSTAERNLRSSADECGIDADRLVFGIRRPKDQHLQRLQLADLALDTRVISGAATTSDALWAGLPVVTIQGRHFASRMSASIVKAIGLPELVTPDLAAYEALAVNLARQPDALRAIRQKLERERMSAPLFDTSRFARHLEAAYREMWRRFLSNQTATALIVPETSDYAVPTESIY